MVSDDTLGCYLLYILSYPIYTAIAPIMTDRMGTAPIANILLFLIPPSLASAKSDKPP